MSLMPYSRTGKVKASAIRKFSNYEGRGRDVVLDGEEEVILMEFKRCSNSKEVSNVAGDPSDGVDDTDSL